MGKAFVKKEDNSRGTQGSKKVRLFAVIPPQKMPMGFWIIKHFFIKNILEITTFVKAKLKPLTIPLTKSDPFSAINILKLESNSINSVFYFFLLNIA